MRNGNQLAIRNGSDSDSDSYLSPVIDCYDGLVVAWRIGRRPNAALANGSLEDACGTLSPGQHPICHSDRGCHYRWPGWIGICEGNGLTRSMSKKGCSPDNSACEGFFGRLKNTDNGESRYRRGLSAKMRMSRRDGPLKNCRRFQRLASTRRASRRPRPRPANDLIGAWARARGPSNPHGTAPHQCSV